MRVSQFRQTLVLAALALILSLVTSCRSPALAGGEATLSLSLGGAVPPLRAYAAEAGTRAISAATARIRVSVSGTDGFAYIKLFDYVPGSSLVMPGLPVAQELTIEIDALDRSDAVITHWSGSRTLGFGLNSVPAALTPATIMVLNVNDTTMYDIDPGASLAPGESVFYALTFDASASGERHILADTGKARWLWMQAYDADWAPLPLVASDSGQGWVVAGVAPGQVVNLAVANAVRSPAYPEGGIDFSLQAREAVFAAPGASGAGTSADPASLTDNLVSYGSYFLSVFLREGTYDTGDGLMVDNAGSVRIYGGFSGGSWRSRSSRAYVSSLRQTSPGDYALDITAEVSGDSALDGLTVIAGDLDATSTSRKALHLGANGAVVLVNDCVIRGSQDTVPDAVALASVGVFVDGCDSEIANSLVSAGKAIASGTGNAIAHGVDIMSGTVYLHGCAVDGGLAEAAAGEAQTAGVYVESTALSRLIMAGSRVWGGVARSGTDSPLSETVGVFFAESSGISILANSAISGGSAVPLAATVPAHSYGIRDEAGPNVIAGVAVDSGRAVSGPSLFSAYAAHRSINSGGNFLSSIVYSSTDSFSSQGAVIHVNPGSYTHGGNIGLQVPSFTDGTATDDVLPGTANSFSVTPPASFFRTYVRIFSGAADTWFDQWRQLDLRADTAWAGAVAGALNPVSGGQITASSLADYPALGIDLSGSPRPSVAPWSRGAYQ